MVFDKQTYILLSRISFPINNIECEIDFECKINVEIKIKIVNVESKYEIN